MLIHSIKHNQQKHSSPLPDLKKYVNTKNSDKSSVFINNSFLSKFLKSRQHSSPIHQNKSTSFSLSPQHRNSANLQQLQLHKKLKLVSLIKSDRKSYDESNIKLSQCKYKAINRKIQYLMHRKRKRRTKLQEDEIIDGDLQSSRYNSNAQMASNILKITKSLQHNHHSDYIKYNINSSRSNGRDYSLKLQLSKKTQNQNTEPQHHNQIDQCQDRVDCQFKTQNNRAIQEERQGNSSNDECQDAKKSFRHNIKLRPTPKMKWTINKKEKQTRHDRVIMNTSVRGWTKYPIKPLNFEDDIDHSL